ncbi:hypothetical protein CASFOL_040039 [Castilleja foliolosa]|uniref:Cysteine-rich receptor-like protein kinase 2 n=1 Tax=Castilleja foliolosa TaxID=1961234 RepID=A0ABD3BG27_9LAMI
METSRGNWVWWLRLVAAAATMSMWWQTADSQRQDNLLNIGCSQYNSSNIPNFYRNLNLTFTELRSQLSGGRQFATAEEERSSNPVYAMVQCRNYLSERDCLACYNTAASQIRNCSAGNGGRIIYDDCFLRYESNNFYSNPTELGDIQICGNRTAPTNQSIAYGLTFIQDLVTATPRTNGFFAATSRVVSNEVENHNLTLYGVAQCAETIGRAGCQTCLNQALSNIQGCLPIVDGRAIDVACFLRYSDRPFFPANRTMDILPFLLVEEGDVNSRKKWAIIGGVGGGALLVLVLLAYLLWYNLSSRKQNAQPRRANILGATELQGPNIYSYKDLKTATNNFSEENKLGEGGFGDVYKATLKNGTVVAVKKLDITYSTAKADFEAEVRLISNVHHRNLVRLLGCCSKGSELFLIYEYMANGSLDRYLYGNKRGSLTWKQRFDIIFGTARGLAYLHEQYHVCIIHRDIKPGNILLDDEFKAKIADFGLARLLPENQSHVSTKFAGTLGYTAPEYAIHGHLSEKVDIYSFGVVILEIISGRRSSDMDSASDTEFLLQEATLFCSAWKLYESGSHLKLIDESLASDEYNPEDLKKMVELALICTQSPTSSRPTMSEILVMLLSDRSAEHKAPSRPSFSYGNIVNGDTIYTGSSASNATASISQFTGR